MGCGNQAGFKHPVACFNGFFNVQGADEPIFGGTDGQVNYGYLAGHRL
jgi:hypothetical protein